jgi:hypothetical protein
MRLLAALAAACAAAGCASAQPDLDGWPSATAAIGGALVPAFARLGDAADAAAAEPAARRAAAARIGALAREAQPCVEAWKAMERYAQRALDGVERDPWSRAGTELQIEALASLHRELLSCGAVQDDPLGGAITVRIARGMRDAPSNAAAFALASEATMLLAEEAVRAHERLADAVAAAAAACAAPLAEEAAALEARHALARREAEALEDELRMEAAGAGRARPEAAALAETARRAAARAAEELAAQRARASGLAAAFADCAERVRRSGFAAREWALAHRDAGRAWRDGELPARESLLERSAAELR